MLDHTRADAPQRTALRINPARTCQPIGAMYAALGIHGCLPHSHGSQGCCSYHRSHLTRHHREPVMASTSSFTEAAAVFGGADNLVEALDTIFSVYRPDIVAVHTTCLSETIGDDIPTIVARAREEGVIPAGRHVVHANTPSYAGSHVTGFSAMTAAMARHFTSLATSLGTSRGTAPEQADQPPRADQPPQPGEPLRAPARSQADQPVAPRVNVIPGFVDPSDMREIRRLARALGTAPVLLPDTTSVLDAPQEGTHRFYPSGGTTLDELLGLGTASATLALGRWASREAAVVIQDQTGVPHEVLTLPIGIQATDRFVMALRARTGGEVPAWLTRERGRLVDLMIDAHQHLDGRTVAIFGDPDHLLAMTEFLLDLNMRPVHILTGTSGKAFPKQVTALLGGNTAGNTAGTTIAGNGDLFQLHQWLKTTPVDLLIGNSYGKHIARAEDIPLLRFGWPILDRFGHQCFPSVGYRGAMRLVERILDTLLERRDRDSPDAQFELVL